MMNRENHLCNRIDLIRAYNDFIWSMYKNYDIKEEWEDKTNLVECPSSNLINDIAINIQRFNDIDTIFHDLIITPAKTKMPESPCDYTVQCAFTIKISLQVQAPKGATSKELKKLLEEEMGEVSDYQELNLDSYEVIMTEQMQENGEIIEI